MAAARKLLVGPGIGYPFLTGACVFAALAFPGPKEDDARQEAEAAYVTSWLHAQNAVDGTDAPFADPALNDFVRREPAWVRQKLRTSGRRLGDRQKAARAVRPWVKELVGLGSHDPVSGISKFAQRQIALHLCDRDEERAVRFQKRVWRPSRPVLHVAVAIDEALTRIQSANTNFDLSLDALVVFEPMVGRAAALQSLMVADRRFGLNAADQITFRWIA